VKKYFHFKDTIQTKLLSTTNFMKYC